MDYKADHDNIASLIGYYNLISRIYGRDMARELIETDLDGKVLPLFHDYFSNLVKSVAKERNS